MIGFDCMLVSRILAAHFAADPAYAKHTAKREKKTFRESTLISLV